MNKHRKQLLAVPLIIALIAVSGCSSSKSKASSSNQPFRVFSPVDRTGADAAVGGFWSTGLNAAVKQINANGGIDGRTVVVTYADTQSNPQVATTVTQQALASGTYQAMVPTAAAGSSPPIMQLANRYKILTVGASSLLNMGDPKMYPTTFTTVIPQPAQGQASACLAIASFHPKTVAYLYVQDPTFPGQFPGMDPVWSKYGVKVVASEGFPFAATDATPQVEKIMAAHPDVLIIGAYFNALSTAIKAIDTLNYTNVHLVGNTETSAAPPSSFLSSSTPLPPIESVQWAVNSRVGGALSPIQKDADAAISPAIDGKYSAVIATYLYDYDALQLIKYAAVTSHSDSTPNMVKALEGLGSHPNTNTGTYIVTNPGFTASNHGLSSPMYSVNIQGDYVSGTFPTNGNTPIADCLK